MKPPRSLAAAAALLALGCGVKTEPWPAMDVLPGPARELTETVTAEGEIALSWLPPTANMAGRDLAEGGLAGFRVEMAETPAATYCAGCPVAYETAGVLSAAEGGERYAWRRPLNRDSAYRFRVVSLGRGGNSHPQAHVEAEARLAAAVPPLAGFRLELEDKAVRLAWDQAAAGQTAQVQKRGADGQWRDLPDVAGASYADVAVEYENTYAYRGRLTAREGQALAVGPWSPVLTADVIDETPPSPPGYLDAAVAPGGVRLKWEAVLEPGVAGYRLYRQREGDKSFKALGGLMAANSYYDTSAPVGSGQLARYRVTAIDDSPRANESRPSPVADVYLDDNPAPPERPEP